MARIDTLREIYCKKRLIKDFDFDGLLHFPISYYLITSDVSRLHYLATSAKYGSKSKKEKFAMVDAILEPRGFKRCNSGTNRIVYRNDYDQSFLLKVAIDAVGIRDNPDEMFNQKFVKPFVTKIFDVSPCGTVSLVERVNPISNRYEFEDIASEIFDILHNFFIGKYVLEDIGTDFFKNWGIRDGFGPVLLDFPYLYETDGDKLQCSAILPNGQHCDGIIDYDSGLNTLVCEKCGHRYTARSLGKANNVRSIKSKIIEEDSNMESEILVSTVMNGKEYKLYNESNCIAPMANNKVKKHKATEDDLVAYVTGAGIKQPEQKRDQSYYDKSIVNPKTIKDIEKKMNESQVAKDKQEKEVVVKTQTVQSPDVKEEEVEVPRKSFHGANTNSKLEPQDEKTEKDFADETKKEQKELEQKEIKSKSQKVTAKERALITRFMTAQMKKFPFDQYTESTPTQRNDMIDYLVVCVSSKYSLEPEMTVMIVTGFIDSQYQFDDVAKDAKKAEELAKKHYDGKYDEQPSVEPMSKRGGISKEF